MANSGSFGSTPRRLRRAADVDELSGAGAKNHELERAYDAERIAPAIEAA